MIVFEKDSPKTNKTADLCQLELCKLEPSILFYVEYSDAMSWSVHYLVGFKKACARTHRRNSIFPTFHNLNNLNILLNVFYIKKDLKKHFINILKH